MAIELVIALAAVELYREFGLSDLPHRLDPASIFGPDVESDSIFDVPTLCIR